MKYNDNSDWHVSAETGGEPVTLDEVKAQLSLKFETSGSFEFTDDDNFITQLIGVAREACEDYAGISIKHKTIFATLRNECGGVVIPKGPVYQIDEAVDRDNNDLALTTDGNLFPRIITPKCDYINVQYTAGYAALGADYARLPKAIKQAVIVETAWRYINRGENNDAGIGSAQARQLLAPYNKKSWLV